MAANNALCLNILLYLRDFSSVPGSLETSAFKSRSRRMPSGLLFAFEVGSSDLGLLDLLTDDVQGKYIWTFGRIVFSNMFKGYIAYR